MNRFCEYNIFWFFSLKQPFGHALQNSSFEKFRKTYRKRPVPEFFFLENVAHHQGCNFIKKRLQIRCFNMNFTKLLNTLCRTPPVSVSNFNSTFLTLRPHKRYIYVLPALIVLIVLSHFMLLMDTKNKS